MPRIGNVSTKPVVPGCRWRRRFAVRRAFAGRGRAVSFTRWRAAASCPPRRESIGPPSPDETHQEAGGTKAGARAASSAPSRPSLGRDNRLLSSPTVSGAGACSESQAKKPAFRPPRVPRDSAARRQARRPRLPSLHAPILVARERPDVIAAAVSLAISAVIDDSPGRKGRLAEARVSAACFIRSTCRPRLRSIEPPPARSDRLPGRALDHPALTDAGEPTAPPAASGRALHTPGRRPAIRDHSSPESNQHRSRRGRKGSHLRPRELQP